MWQAIVWPCGFFSVPSRGQLPPQTLLISFASPFPEPRASVRARLFLVRPFPGASHEVAFAAFVGDGTGSCPSGRPKPTRGRPFGTYNRSSPSICCRLFKLIKKPPSPLCSALHSGQPCCFALRSPLPQHALKAAAPAFFLFPQ